MSKALAVRCVSIGFSRIFIFAFCGSRGLPDANIPRSSRRELRQLVDGLHTFVSVLQVRAAAGCEEARVAPGLVSSDSRLFKLPYRALGGIQRTIGTKKLSAMRSVSMRAKDKRRRLGCQRLGCSRRHLLCFAHLRPPFRRRSHLHQVQHRKADIPAAGNIECHRRFRALQCRPSRACRSPSHFGIPKCRWRTPVPS